MTPLDQILRAVADGTRLRLLALLQEGPICVCDIHTALAIPQPTVSRHLAVLRHAGLVVDRRTGPRVVYSLAKPEAPALRALWQFLREVLPQDEAVRADRARLRQARLNSGPTSLTEVTPG